MPVSKQEIIPAQFCTQSSQSIETDRLIYFGATPQGVPGGEYFHRNLTQCEIMSWIMGQYSMQNI